MIWLFERDGRHARVQLLYLHPNKCELHFFNETDGVERVEHYTNAEDAATRQRQLQDILAVQGWSKAGDWKL
jgi:hypothetical protein